MAQISSYLVDENSRKVDPLRWSHDMKPSDKVRAKLASSPVAAGQAMITIYGVLFWSSGD